MKAIDEKGRLFGKLHIFDLLVILLVLVGLIAMATRPLRLEQEEAQLHRATYDFEILSVQEFGTTAFSVGDMLYEGETEIGEITAVTSRPARDTRVLSDGSVRLAEHCLYYDVTLTISTDQMRVENGYYINKQEVLNGTVHTVSNGLIICDGRIRQITVE